MHFPWAWLLRRIHALSPCREVSVLPSPVVGHTILLTISVDCCAVCPLVRLRRGSGTLFTRCTITTTCTLSVRSAFCCVRCLIIVLRRYFIDRGWMSSRCRVFASTLCRLAMEQWVLCCCSVKRIQSTGGGRFNALKWTAGKCAPICW